MNVRNFEGRRLHFFPSSIMHSSLNETPSVPRRDSFFDSNSLTRENNPLLSRARMYRETERRESPTPVIETMRRGAVSIFPMGAGSGNGMLIAGAFAIETAIDFSTIESSARWAIAPTNNPQSGWLLIRRLVSSSFFAAEDSALYRSAVTVAICAWSLVISRLCRIASRLSSQESLQLIATSKAAKANAPQNAAQPRA